MKLRWFLSSTVRQATDVAKHVHKLLCAQRDILTPQAVQALETSLRETWSVIDSDNGKETLKKQMAELEKAANKWLKPYPHATWRENVDTLLTVIVVVMALRTFFVLNFKIPTGSMQPTLFGITVTNLENSADFTMPGPARCVYDAIVHGTFYHEKLALDDGQIIGVPKVKSLGITKQPVVVQYKNQVTSTVIPIWFAPDNPAEAGIFPGKTFTKGSPIFRFQEKSGDHLFVNRLTYNFRRPERGEIIVFTTHGIDTLTERVPSMDNQFYIKRLVGLPGESIKIGADRHIYINGARLDSSTPHFENVYNFDPQIPARNSQYSGHIQILSDPIFPAMGDKEVKIPLKSYFVCGDNTANSLDSRFWGSVPENNVIGKYCFVYWPISERFGWGQK